jgi:hypothetical protein
MSNDSNSGNLQSKFRVMTGSRKWVEERRACFFNFGSCVHLVACRGETVRSAIETGAPRLDSETWVHLFVPLTFSPRQATSGLYQLVQEWNQICENARLFLGVASLMLCIRARL